MNNMKPELKIQQAPFALPPLQEVAEIVNNELKHNYELATAQVVDCPDLRQMQCPAAGLGGLPALVDIGGEPYAHNSRYRDIQFNLDEIATKCGIPTAYALGAALAHRNVINGNCGEMIPSVKLGGNNYSKVARVGKEQEAIIEPYPSCLHGGLGNYFICEGKPGPVIKIEVNKRIGEQASFPQAIRNALLKLRDESNNKELGNELGMGGVFEMTGGKVRSHIMPNLECIAHKYYDEEKDEVIKDFLQFYESMGPQLLCFSVFWTGDPTGGRLHLRDNHEHTHFYHQGDEQQGGHYHYDVTPDEVAYRGYFNLAAKVYRVNDIYAELA